MTMKKISEKHSAMMNEGGSEMLSDLDLEKVGGGFDTKSAYKCPATGCTGTPKLSTKRARVAGCNITLYYCDVCMRYYSSEQVKGEEDLTKDYTADAMNPVDY